MDFERNRWEEIERVIESNTSNQKEKIKMINYSPNQGHASNGLKNVRKSPKFNFFAITVVQFCINLFFLFENVEQSILENKYEQIKFTIMQTTEIQKKKLVFRLKYAIYTCIFWKLFILEALTPSSIEVNRADTTSQNSLQQ